MTDSNDSKLPSFKSNSKENNKMKNKRPVKLQSLPELDKLLNDFDREPDSNPEDIKKVEAAINKVLNKANVDKSEKSKDRPKPSFFKKSDLPDFVNIYDDDFNLKEKEYESPIPEESKDVHEPSELSEQGEQDKTETSIESITESELIESREIDSEVLIEERLDDTIVVDSDEEKGVSEDPSYIDEGYDNVSLEDEGEEGEAHLVYLIDEDELSDDISEDELEDEEFSFLPTVNTDDESDDDDDEIYNDEVIPGMYTDNGYDDESEQNDGEIDEEALKNFFVNIKNKLFKPKRPRDSSVDEDIVNVKNKDNSEGLSKKLRRNPLEGSNKAYIGAAALVIGIIVSMLVFFGSKYNTISELAFSAKEKESEIQVHFEEFSYDDTNDFINYKVINEGELSADFFFEAELKEKSFIPFYGSKIECESDIIALESDGSSMESIRCKGFQEDKKYKMKVNIVEVK